MATLPLTWILWFWKTTFDHPFPPLIAKPDPHHNHSPQLCAQQSRTWHRRLWVETALQLLWLAWTAHQSGHSHRAHRLLWQQLQRSRLRQDRSWKCVWLHLTKPSVPQEPQPPIHQGSQPLPEQARFGLTLEHRFVVPSVDKPHQLGQPCCQGSQHHSSRKRHEMGA